MTNQITHWINGKSWTGKTDKKGDVFNPATGLKTGEVDFADISTIDKQLVLPTVHFRIGAILHLPNVLKLFLNLENY